MIKIRYAEYQEFDKVKQFIRQIFPNEIVAVNTEDTLLVAEEEGKFVGFAHILEDQERLILQGIGVDENARNQGVGSLIMERVSEITRQNAKPVYLKVKALNPAMNIYEKYGFSLKRFGEVCILVKKMNN